MTARWYLSWHVRRKCTSCVSVSRCSVRYLRGQRAHRGAGLDDGALVLVVARAQEVHQLRQRSAPAASASAAAVCGTCAASAPTAVPGSMTARWYLSWHVRRKCTSCVSVGRCSVRYLRGQRAHRGAGLDDGALVLVVARAQEVHQLRQRQPLQCAVPARPARPPRCRAR
ncbi:hypothetical protein ACJJTC_009049 [Scirpophaga incertulas]